MTDTPPKRDPVAEFYRTDWSVERKPTTHPEHDESIDAQAIDVHSRKLEREKVSRDTDWIRTGMNFVGCEYAGEIEAVPSFRSSGRAGSVAPVFTTALARRSPRR